MKDDRRQVAIQADWRAAGGKNLGREKRSTICMFKYIGRRGRWGLGGGEGVAWMVSFKGTVLSRLDLSETVIFEWASVGDR